MYFFSLITVRWRHHIVPNWSLKSISSAHITCSNSIQSSKDAKKEKGEQTKKTNKPTQKQGESKSSLELCLDCGIQEYFTLSDPSVNLAESWLLVWMRSGHITQKVIEDWKYPGKVKETSDQNYWSWCNLLLTSSLRDNTAIWLRKLLQISNLRTFPHFSSVEYLFKSQSLLRVREHKLPV